MSESLANSRYARALFGLAIKTNKLADVEISLLNLAKNLEAHPEVMAIVQNPTLRENEKFSLVEKLLPHEPPQLLKDFLRLLLEKKRFQILPEVQAEFHKMFEKKQNILEVEVVSAVPFSAALQEKLKKVLAAKFRTAPEPAEFKAQRDIRLIPKTDPSLLGGLLLRFNDREIDCSFKNRIREIEQQLIPT